MTGEVTDQFCTNGCGWIHRVGRKSLVDSPLYPPYKSAIFQFRKKVKTESMLENGASRWFYLQHERSREVWLVETNSGVILGQ